MAWTRTFSCDWCGEEFQGQRDRWEGNYCPGSSKCRTAAYRQKKRITTLQAQLEVAIARLNKYRTRPFRTGVQAVLN